MRTIFLSPFAGAATALALIACSSAPSDSEPASGSVEDAIHIKPTDNENWSHVTLQLPTDSCQPGAICAKVLGHSPSLFIDGAAVGLGANTRLKPGTHDIAVNNVGWQVTTTPGQNLTATLPIVRRKCTNAVLPNVPTTDFGGNVSVSNAACPSTAQGSATGVPASVGTANKTEYYDATCTSVWAYSVTGPNCSNYYYYPSAVFAYRDNSGACVTTGMGYASCVAAANAIVGLVATSPGTATLADSYEAYAPGTLTATVNGAAQSLTLNQGDELDFALTLPVIGAVPSTFATTLTFGDPRDNPDVTRGTITSSCSGDRTYTIASGTGTPAPLTLSAFVNPSCVYTLNVGGRTQTLNQTQSNAIVLRRLDVDDITISREDGSQYTVSGNYTLNFGGVQVAGPFPTGTGVDVLPGTYQFSLSYTDADGPRQQTQTLTF